MEKAEVRAVLNTASEAVLRSTRFWDSAPREVYATLLDEDEYLCHWRTMYRILEEHDEVHERRNQRRHPVSVKPELRATGPNQLWSWDITQMRGPTGVYYYLYVILDVFSRFVPGWMIAERELARLAEQLIGETCAKQGIARDRLVLHSDRGSAMRTKTVAQLLFHLGVAKSHSRPYTPTDDPYSESQFKTMKYRPEYPERFDEREEARSWAREFFGWYNHEHHHSGLGLMTPAAVHSGLAEKVHEQRRQVLRSPKGGFAATASEAVAMAYAAHPEVWINPPQNSHKAADLVDAETDEVELDTQAVPRERCARNLDSIQNLAPMEQMPDSPHFREIVLPKLERELSQNR